MRKLFLAFLVLAVSCSCPAQGKKDQPRFYPVLRIIDGDTFVIADGSPKGKTVRLIGIDAPESRNTGRKIKSEFGKVSKAYLSKLIGDKRVRLEYDVDRTDRYGRTLAYVYLESGAFVNAELVKNGYANIMTVPPNVKYQDLFLRLERRARNQGRGLWGK